METHVKAEKDYMRGMKYKDVAAKYGVSINTVKSWKVRYKWERGPDAKKTCAHTKKQTAKKKTAAQQKKSVRKQKEKPLPLVKITDVSEELTEQQRLFCYFYVNNRNASQAAIKAGYSPKTAGQQGWQLLQKPLIRSEVDRLRKLKYETLMLLDGDDVVEKYMRMAFADMKDFVDFGVEEHVMYDSTGAMVLDKNGDIKTYKTSYVHVKNAEEVDGSLISEISMGRNGVKVKLVNQERAMAWLSDYFKLNPMNRHKVAYDNAMLALKQKQVDAEVW